MIKHTFVICAYKKSEYLEECICSILKQTIKSNVLISTSTDIPFIREMAKKYDIPLYVAEHKSDIAKDWNFAYKKANTKYVTIAHQDDIYDADYAKTAISMLEKNKKPLIFFSDYYEIKNGRKVAVTKNLKIKRILLYPLRAEILQSRKIVKRTALDFGNPICCPAVTYVKENLPEELFKQGYKSNIDWEAWELLSRKKGSFVYHPKSLMGHRVHEQSTTTEIIGSNLRTLEDVEILKKFWPEKIAKAIGKVYKKSEESNNA